MCKIIDFSLAAKAREGFNAVKRFAYCELNEHSHREYVDTLIKHDMLYYFEEDAEDAVDEEDQPLFSHKQATILNYIKIRFQQVGKYDLLFKEVEDRYLLAL